MPTTPKDDVQKISADAAALLQKVKEDSRQATMRATELEAELARLEGELEGEEVELESDVAKYEAEALRALTAAADDLLDETEEPEA